MTLPHINSLLQNKKSPKILHIVNDEKFISAAGLLFEKAFPGSNHFLIIKPPADPPLKYVDPNTVIETVVLGQGAIKQMIVRVKDADAVVMHGIDRVKGTLLDRSEDKKKFSGIIFGAELYNESVTGDDYLGPKTRRVKKQLDRPGLLDMAKKIYRAVAYRNSKNEVKNIPRHEVTRQLRCIGTHYPASLEKWKRIGAISNTVETFHFSYYPLELIIPDDTLRVTGKNILVGNSASYTNNHFEILDLLKETGIKERSIVLPLGYGKSRYAKTVEKKGKSLFEKQFRAEKQYLPYEAFNKLIADCEIVVMNHKRSQALGTTLAALYLGARVFLNDTDVYRYFSSIGCKVFSIRDELKDELINGAPLEPEVIENNRNCIRAWFSEDVIVRGIQTSFNDRYDFDVN